ncbi:MAG: CatB-related O-acetyltransferase [Lachnospiraceae bacterium]|nr:CatB-related O-acetyltransferase [Lachnospiraceae bacterium]
MGLIKRKIEESGSILYRFWVWPMVRIIKEIGTKSIMKSGSYLIRTELKGRNFVGKNAFLKDSSLGFGSYVQSGCDLVNTDIGRYTSIGSDVKTVIGSHPVDGHVAMHPAFYTSRSVTGFSYVKDDLKTEPEKRTSVGSDVWIGNDVRIMGGVSIGDGAVVGAGALVTRDLPPFSVNVGVPAKTIRYRFSEDEIRALKEEAWWDKDEAWIASNIDRFSDIREFLK